MSDWKDALAALGGTIEAAESENKQNSTGERHDKTVERKKRVGVVFSTNPDFSYTEDVEDEAATLPNNQQRLRISMERAGRGGKTVTLVRGFVGTGDDLAALAKLLKQRCGVGGAAKDGEIIIQGDHRQRLVDILKREGYTQTK